MDWDRIEGNWKQFSGKVKEKWGQLTDDEIDTRATSLVAAADALTEQLGGRRP